MCGSACLPEGGAHSAALPLISPQSGPGAPRPHPGRPLEVTWRGGVHALSPAELPDRPGRRGFGSSDPPAPGKLLPSSPQRRPDARPSRRPKPGDSQSGGPCREVPRPLHFPATRAWKLSHRLLSTAPLEGRDRPWTPPTPLRRNTTSSPPESGPHPVEPAPEPSQPQAGSYLSSWCSWWVPDSPPRPALVPTPRVPAGPEPLGARQAGLRARSQGLARASAPLGAAPPPSSCRLTQPAGMGRDGRTRGAPGPRPAPPLGGVTGGSPPRGDWRGSSPGGSGVWVKGVKP